MPDKKLSWMNKTLKMEKITSWIGIAAKIKYKTCLNSLSTEIPLLFKAKDKHWRPVGEFKIIGCPKDGVMLLCACLSQII